MARTAIPIMTYGSNASLDVFGTVEQPFDHANGMKFPNDGKTILIIANDGGDLLSDTITVHSVSDPYGRTGDLVAPISGNPVSDDVDFTVMGPFPPALWNQTDGFVYLDNVNAPDVSTSYIAAVRLPG